MNIFHPLNKINQTMMKCLLWKVNSQIWWKIIQTLKKKSKNKILKQLNWTKKKSHRSTNKRQLQLLMRQLLLYHNQTHNQLWLQLVIHNQQVELLNQKLKIFKRLIQHQLNQKLKQKNQSQLKELLFRSKKIFKRKQV